MTKFYVKKMHSTLVPADEYSAEELDELPFGKILEIEVRHKRSLEHNALYWVMCKKIAAGLGISHRTVSDNFLHEAGRYTLERVKNLETGEQIWVERLDSTSFEKMDQTEFNQFFRECVQVAYDKWGIPPEELEPLLQEHDG